MQNSNIIKINPSRNLVLLVAAFAAVYIFWGSTYLAIKYAIETLPPFLMAGARFEGPAIVTQDDATTVVPPGFAVGVDGWGNLVIAPEA